MFLFEGLANHRPAQVEEREKDKVAQKARCALNYVERPTPRHPLSLWKKGLCFAGSLLGSVRLGAVDEDDSALHTLTER
jgi:hypothetical protein